MKRVCFFIGDITRSGGTERVTAELVNALYESYEEEYKISILSLTEAFDKRFFEINSNIQCYSLMDNNVKIKKDFFKVLVNLRTFLKTNEVEILIDVDSILDVFSIPASCFLKTKIISWEHFNYYENLGSPFRSFGRWLASKFANHIVTITEEDLNNFKANLNLRCSITNIYNPIKINNHIEDYNIDSKLIVSAGRLTYQKGFDMLLDVAKIIFKENNDWKWIVLGEGEDRLKLENKIKQYKLEENVILKGNVSNIGDYYKNSSIFVLTSRYEGLGMVLLEALNYGIPVVSFDCPVGPKEIVSHGKNGYLISIGDYHQMAKIIAQLINDDNLRKSIASNAQIDLEKFDINRIVHQWSELLNQV